MTPVDIRQEQTAHQFSTPTMARMCGVSVRTIERWRAGERIPGSARRLIEVYRELRTVAPGAMAHMIRTFNKEEL